MGEGYEASREPAAAAEGEAKLKQQQNLYEAVRPDRNLYSKQLIESQDEIAEMKRKFKIMNHQIEQLKEEIQAKDTSLVREHFEHMKVAQEKEQLKEALTAMNGGKVCRRCPHRVTQKVALRGG